MSIAVEQAGRLLGALRERTGSQARRLEGIRLPRLLVYGIPAMVALAISQTWFASGTFIASGDLAPFVRDNLWGEAGGLWSHSITGAGSPSFQAAARAPELAILSVGHTLGFSNETAQRIFYAILAVAVAVSAVYFVLAFVEGALGVILAGLFTLLNPFVLQRLPNPLVLWALALMAVSGGLLVRAARGAQAPGLALGSLSLLAGYLSLNPPLLAVLGAWIVLVASLGGMIGGPGGSRRALGLFLRAAPWALVLALWWAVPLVLTLTQSGTGYGVAAETNALAWTWTQGRNTIPNVLTLSGGWGWAYPEYYPYASAMNGTFWASLKFGMPILAFLAPFAARRAKRRAAAVLAAVAVVLLFLSKGMHPPLSGVNLFLYRHVPGMWLLRTPDSKLGLPILLIYLVLIAFAVDGITELVQKHSGRTRRWLIRTTSVMAVAALAYPYPVWTGDVIPDRRPVLPPAHVKIPAAWQAVASFLNRSTVPGKALVLPLDDFYQMPTTWGYYGVDAIPRSMLNRPTIQPSPGGYYADLAPFRSLVSATQTALQNGDSIAASRLLRSLGVTYVILRHDINLRYFAAIRGARSVVDAGTLEKSLGAAPAVRLVRSTNVADVYQVEDAGRGPIAVATPIFNLQATGPRALPLAVGSLPAGSAIVADALPATTAPVYATTPAHPTMGFEWGGGKAVVAARRTSNELAWARVESRGKHSTLRLMRAAVVQIDGASLPSAPIVTMRLPPKPVLAVGVEGRISLLSRGAALVSLGPSPQITAYAAAEAAETSAGPFSPVGDCNRYADRTLAQAGISAQPLVGEPGQAIRLEARYHSACVDSLVRGVIPGASYLLSFQYRTINGRPARVCLREVEIGRCAVLPPLEPSSMWRTFRAVVTPDPATTRLRLVLYADGTAGGRSTVTEYRQPDVVRLHQLASKKVALGLPPEWTISLHGGLHSVGVHAPQQASLLALSPVGDCNRYADRTLAQAGISAQPLVGEPGQAIRLEARYHSACVDSLVRGVIPGASYLLSFQYRTINGRPARVCLREVEIGRCAVLPPLEPSSMWRTFRAVVTPDPATTRLRLVLYADGTAGGRSTVTEYRGLRIIDALPFGAVVYPRTTRESSTPAIHWQREGSSSLDVTVGPTDRPSLLLLRESFSDGWKLHEFPFGRAHQAEVDGYGNGWLVQPGPGLLGKITYAPDSWVHRARAVSALGVLAGGLWLFVRTHKRAYRVLSSFRPPWDPGRHDPQDRTVRGHSDESTVDAEGK